MNNYSLKGTDLIAQDLAKIYDFLLGLSLHHKVEVTSTEDAGYGLLFDVVLTFADEDSWLEEKDQAPQVMNGFICIS